MESWFLFALITTFAWGASDFFAKMGAGRNDRYSHWKMTAIVGLVMGAHAALQLLWNDTPYTLSHLVTYLPVSLLYILAMVFNYAGLRYLALSITAPITNASGAIAMVLLLVFMNARMSLLQGVAVGVVSLGVLLLAVFEKQDEDKVLRLAKEKPNAKYVVGAAAILLPILYAVVDGAASFMDGVVLATSLSEYETNISFELTFLVCGLVALFYLSVVKKQKFEPRREAPKLFSALCETAGQFTYVFAMSNKAVLAAPMISATCVISVILSHVFLKERLAPKYYPVILLVMAGIIILGFAE